MTNNHKLGIVVPYRKRPAHLEAFIHHLKYKLKLDCQIIVVEQRGSRPFNRGKLLNIGFIKAKEMGCDYVVFHDVDMIGINCSYDYESKPFHLISKLTTRNPGQRTMLDTYFGGVTLFPVDVFESINGFSNEFSGWGFEDDDLMLRCVENNVDLATVNVKQRNILGPALNFNGKDSYIEFRNNFSPARNFSIFLSFQTLGIDPNVELMTDNQSIFSIPGYDTNLRYDSFFNLSYQYWLKSDKVWEDKPLAHSIVDKSLYKGQFNVVLTYDGKSNRNYCTNKFFINGSLAGEHSYKKLYGISKPGKFFLGAGDPYRYDKPNFFNGNISKFIIFNEALSDSDCIDLTNLNKLELNDLEETAVSNYYDFSTTDNILEDKVGFNNGTIFNCTQTDINHVQDLDKVIPNRKLGEFETLDHKENGYKDGYWIAWNSRLNQIRYINTLNSGKTDYAVDGLNNCTFREYNSETNDNVHHFTVAI